MTKSQDTLLALLRAGIHQTEPSVPAGTDWKEIISLANAQAVTCVVADAVSRLPKEQQPDSATMSHLKLTCIKNMANHTRLNTVVAQIWKVADEKGYRPVLLKGQGLSLLYPNPLLRVCGDIDLYPGKDKAKAFGDALYGEWGLDPSTIDFTSVHYNLEKDGADIEVHTTPLKLNAPWHNSAFQKWMQQQLEGDGKLQIVEIGGQRVFLPPAQYNAVYLFQHMWKHFFSSGVGLRQFSDWALTLTKQNDLIDYAEVERMLQKFGQLKGFKAFAYIAVNYLGVPKDKMPLYDPKIAPLAEAIMEQIMHGGNFGTSSGYMREYYKVQGMMARKWVSAKYMLRRSALLMRCGGSEWFWGLMRRAKASVKSIFKK